MFGPDIYFIVPNDISFWQKRKTVLNSLTQSYVTAIIFCFYFATEN
jgi:hypothetical protein